MTDNQSESQLADQARAALLDAITKAAQSGRGENARHLAEAYGIVTKSAPRNAETAIGTAQYDDRRLEGRR
ncbi:hypothetical protein [Streptomyces sp.]|uniref:hypothetical protein n=1 Tax=Streptomyces sp. TaxID=1931 RepID=UPI002D3DC1F7|nr:hypothetical protein [Streptomyces sp.]HZF92070.1 hypothetical protein [Streptomyces sp.]